MTAYRPRQKVASWRRRYADEHRNIHDARPFAIALVQADLGLVRHRHSGLAVFIGIGLLLVATMNPDSLVRDNYYSEGKAINMTLDRDHHARDLGIAASFAVDSVTGDISLQLEGDLPALPRSLTLDLISPTHASATAR
ncbi:FixH family protein [Halopseudomonas pachastrellae]|nr:FixH family protein [Halopseudomonas pachastrellae]